MISYSDIKLKKIIVLLALIFMITAMLYAADYGKGKAKYNTVKLPDEPAIATTIYYPLSDDAAGLNAAIAAASNAGGGTVQLSTKTYLIDTTILMKDNIRLVGNGIGSTILKRDPKFVLDSTTTNYFIGSKNGSLEDIEIRGLTLDGDYSESELIADKRLVGFYLNSETGYNKRVCVQLVEVKGFGMGIHLKGTTHVTIQYCELHNNGGNYLYHNVYFRRVGQALIHRNNIYDAVGGSGLKLAGGTNTVPNESRYFTITENNIYDNERINLNIQGCNHMLIERNNLNHQKSTTSKMAGLYMVDYNGYTCDSTDIINNVVKENINNGFYVNGCSNFNIEGNACYNNGTDYNLSSNSSFTCDYNTSSEITSVNQKTFSEQENAIKIYPNPVSDILHLSSNSDFTVQLYNMIGESVGKTLESKDEHVFDMSRMEDGIYIVKTHQNGSVREYKLMKNRVN